jgi:hypothetical protein
MNIPLMSAISKIWKSVEYFNIKTNSDPLLKQFSQISLYEMVSKILSFVSSKKKDLQYPNFREMIKQVLNDIHPATRILNSRLVYEFSQMWPKFIHEVHTLTSPKNKDLDLSDLVNKQHLRIQYFNNFI